MTGRQTHVGTADPSGAFLRYLEEIIRIQALIPVYGLKLDLGVACPITAVIKVVYTAGIVVDV